MIFLGSSATIFAVCKLLNLSFYSLLTSENSSKVITLFTLFLILTTLVLMFFFPVGWKKILEQKQLRAERVCSRTHFQVIVHYFTGSQCGRSPDSWSHWSQEVESHEGLHPF